MTTGRLVGLLVCAVSLAAVTVLLVGAAIAVREGVGY